MSSDNPIQEPIQETESTQESQKPESPLLEDSQESEKSEDSADNEKAAEEEGSALTPPRKNNVSGGGSGRERLKRHRVEVAGRVWIPDMWGQEDLLKDWIDCTSFDASLARATILMARDSLAKDARSPTHSTQLRVQDG